jgi:hypothetical protein
VAISGDVDFVKELVNECVVEMAQFTHDVLKFGLGDYTVAVLIEHLETLFDDLFVRLLFRRHFLHAITKLVEVYFAIAVGVNLRVVVLSAGGELHCAPHE